MMTALLLMCATRTAIAASSGRGDTNATPLEHVCSVALPGVAGRLDHFALDSAHNRLFLAGLANNSLEIVDIERCRRLAAISGLAQPTGVVYAASSDQVRVAGGVDGTVRAYVATTRAPAGRIEGLDDADNMRCDRATGLIYVGYGDGKLGVVDSLLTRLVASIPLPGHPESFQLEEHGPRIFVNVPDAHEIAVVDRVQRRAVAHWELGQFAANYPMALDEPTGRLLIGTRNPARLVVLDTTSGRVITAVETSGDADDLFYDVARRRIYISCGEGFLDTIQREDVDRYRRIARQPTRRGARTSYYDAQSDRLFLAVPRQGALDAEVRVYRPK